MPVASRTLSGTPTAAGIFEMTYQVQDGDANTSASDAATLTFTITVQPTEPPFSGTVFINPNVITDADPTTFETLTYTGTGTRLMFDRRTDRFADTPAYLVRGEVPRWTHDRDAGQRRVRQPRSCRAAGGEVASGRSGRIHLILESTSASNSSRSRANATAALWWGLRAQAAHRADGGQGQNSPNASARNESVVATRESDAA